MLRHAARSSAGEEIVAATNPARIVSVPRLPGLADFYDIPNANWEAKDTATFNFETELL